MISSGNKQNGKRGKTRVKSYHIRWSLKKFEGNTGRDTEQKQEMKQQRMLAQKSREEHFVTGDDLAVLEAEFQQNGTQDFSTE